MTRGVPELRMAVTAALMPTFIAIATYDRTQILVDFEGGHALGVMSLMNCLNMNDKLVVGNTA